MKRARALQKTKAEQDLSRQKDREVERYACSHVAHTYTLKLSPLSLSHITQVEPGDRQAEQNRREAEGNDIEVHYLPAVYGEGSGAVSGGVQ